MTSPSSAPAHTVYSVPRPRLLLVHDSSSDEGQGPHATHPRRNESRSNWQALHQRGLELARARIRHEFELCQWLAEAKACRIHARLGFASTREYAERLMGLSPRQCEERLRVGRALEQLPQMRAAFENGELVWSVARELTRVATSGTERDWLHWAEGRLANEVAREVATTRHGEQPRAPGEPIPPERVRHRLSFEVSGETLALFRQLEAQVRAALSGGGEQGGSGQGEGGSIGEIERAVSGSSAFDSNAILFEIARRALDHDPELHVPQLRGRQLGAAAFETGSVTVTGAGPVTGAATGSVIEPEPATGSVIEPEPATGSVIEPEPATGSGTRSDPGRARYQIAITRCDRCKEVTVEAAGRSHSVSSAFAEMVECDAQVLGDVSAAHGKLQRAEQSVPPMIHRAVMRRDHERCAVPGCRNHRFIDVHHVDPRADGGTHDPERLVALCGAHHLACHDGLLLIRGRASAGFTFWHAGGTPYGKVPNAVDQDTAEKVLDALKKLGFSRKRAELLLWQGQQRLAKQGVTLEPNGSASRNASSGESASRNASSGESASRNASSGESASRKPTASSRDAGSNARGTNMSASEALIRAALAGV